MKPGDRQPEEWVERIRQKFGIELRRKGSEFAGPCPICGGEDRFHVAPKARGSGSMIGCRKCESSFGEFCRIVWGAPEPEARAPQSRRPPADRGPDQIWEIRDPDGQVVATKTRWHAHNGHRKKYAWRRAGLSGLDGLQVADLPLYLSERLSSYKTKEPLYIVEGEAAADALHAIGVQVVGTVTGASGCPSESVWRFLSGFKDCIFWPDLDDAGRKHSLNCAAALAAVNSGATIRMLAPEALGLTESGSDAVEWVEMCRQQGDGWGSEAIFGDLATLAERHAKPLMSEPRSPEDQAGPQIVSIAVETFLAMPMQPRSWLLGDLIQERDIAMIHAPRGIGKSYSAMSIAWAIASGGSWLRFAAERPAGVLYCDGEMHAQDLQSRFSQIAKGMGREIVKPLRLLSADAIRLLDPPARDVTLPSLAKAEGQERVRIELAACPEIELVIIDSISTLCQTDYNESDPRSWELMQQWLLELRRNGIATLILHHGGKDGRQRGTSKREDVMTQVLRFQRPADYMPDQGARFEIHFDKGRAVYGDAARPIEASLSTVDGGTQWAWQDLEKSNQERAFDLFRDGADYKEVMETLEISKSHSLRLQKQYREQNGR